MDSLKSKIYLTVFLLAALFLGLGVWNNYRPQIIYASCADMAEKTTNIVQNKDIVQINKDETFDEALNNCLGDAGYYKNY